MATISFYGPGITQAYGGVSAGTAPNIDYLSDAIKCALTTSAYTADLDAHDFFDDVTNEITGTGYSAGGVTLGTKVLSITGGTNTIMFDAADAAWTASSFTAAFGVIYDSTPGTAGTNPLLWLIDFGGDQTVTAGTFTIQFNAAGIATIVY